MFWGTIRFMKDYVNLNRRFSVKKMQEYITELYSDFKIFCNKHKAVIIGSIFLCICIYGYETFNFTLGGDEEREAVLGATGGMVSGGGIKVSIEDFLLTIGRYGNWIFRKIFMYRGIFTPTYTMLVTIVFMLLAVWTWCIIIEKLMPSKKLSNGILILFCGMFLSVPYASAGFIGYSILNSSSACAMYCSALALYLIVNDKKEKDKSNILLAILLTSFVFSIYQSHVNDFICGSCICLLCYSLENELERIRDYFVYIGTYIVVFLGGLLLYMFCDRVIVANLIQKSNYTDQFIVWGNEPYKETVFNLFKGISSFFISDKVPGYPYLLVCLTIYMLTLFAVSFKMKSIWKRILTLLLGGMLVLSGYAASIALGQVLHWATHTAVLLLIAFMWLFSLLYIKELFNKKYLYFLVSFISLIVLLRQIDIDNKIYYSGHLVAELDMEMGYALGTEIEKEIGKASTEKPLIIVGKYYHNVPVALTCGMEGRTIFSRNNIYKVYLLNYLGFPYKSANDAESLHMAEEKAEQMPVWPEEGCILETEENIIVHLSDIK